MTKRPKLSLSSPQQKTQKRPSTFKFAAAPSNPTRNAPPEPPAKRATSIPTPSPRPASASTPTRAKRADVSAPKQPTWRSAGTIAKTMLVVGVAVLSIFLLKRRML